VRGVRRLLVEGGAGLLTRMLGERLADELQVVIAPFFVGDPGAPRLVGAGRTPQLRLVETRRMEDRVLLRYLLPLAADRADPAADRRWMAAAVELSGRCRPSPTAFSVGAVLVGSDGREIAGGYSRESYGTEHAEQSAVRKADAVGADLVGGTLYSTLEPCGARLSAPEPCADLVARRGLRRVVYALAEPELFVTPQGLRTLRSNAVTVEVVDELAEQVRAVNAHLLDQAP
jgi:5-amino-6-(5-phosphoribosylamino)uracil reductase